VPSNTSYFLWVFMGFTLVTAVLVVSLGRVGTSTAGVKMYNLGFAVFTVFDPAVGDLAHRTGRRDMDHRHRVFQGIGRGVLFANSTAILTDASRRTNGARRWGSTASPRWADRSSA